MCDFCGDGWRFETTEISSGRVKSVLHPTAVSWDDLLSQVGNFQIDIPARDSALSDVFPDLSGFYISRINEDGVTRTGYFGGIIRQAGAVDAATGIATIGGHSLDFYLYQRVLAGPNSGLAYKVEKRQTKIAADLVNIYAGYQEPEIPRESAIPLTADFIPGDTIREVSYKSWEFKNLGQAIQELVEADDGLEYRMSHFYDAGFWRTVVTFSDEIGDVRNLTLRGDIEGWQYGVNVDAKDHATWTYGIGAGEKTDQLESIAYDPTNTYPYFHTVQSWKDAKKLKVLDPLTKGWTKYHRDPVATPLITIAGLQPPAPSPTEMLTGDTVDVDIEYGMITYKDPARILGIGWSLSIDAPVKRTLTLMPIIRPSKSMLVQQPINPQPPTPGGPVAEPKPGLVAYVTDQRIDEMSGMARSVTSQGVYVHNDEVENPQIYLVGLPSGDTIGTIQFTTPLPADGDPEAIRRNPKNSKIVLADIGNNDFERSTFRFYVFDDLGAGAHTVTPTVHTMQYPGQAKLNAEALLIHPTTGTYYIITKGSPNGQLFKFTPGQPTAVNLNKAMPANVSDATFTNGGGFALIRSADRDAIDVFQTKTWAKVGTIAAPHVNKGESITMNNDGRSFLIGSEGLNAPIYRVILPTKWRDYPEDTGTGTAVYPADIFGKNWKLTLPI